MTENAAIRFRGRGLGGESKSGIAYFACAMFPILSARTPFVAILVAIILSGCASHMPSVGKFMRPGDVQIGASFHYVANSFESRWEEPFDTVNDESGSEHVTREPNLVAPLSLYWGDGIRGGIETGLFTFTTAVLGVKRNGYGAMAWLGESQSAFAGGLALARSWWSNEFLDAGVFGYGALNQVEHMKWDGGGATATATHEGFHSFREFGAGTWMNIGRLSGGSIEGRLGYAFDGGGWKARMAASLDLGFRFESGDDDDR